MKKKLITTCACICVSILLLSSTCVKNGNCHSTATFINNSDSDIYVLGLSEGCPDTNYWRRSWMASPANLGEADNSRVKSKDQSDKPLRAGVERDVCYKDFMFKPESDTIMVYVFDEHLLDTTPWDTVKATNMYLKRYDLSYQDLQDSNWRISYP